MSLRMLCMECSRPVGGAVGDHICVGDLGWRHTALVLIWRLAMAQGGAIWN
mgnify:CR=1 FL=1